MLGLDFKLIKMFIDVTRTKRQNTHILETEKVYDVILKPKHLKFCTRTFHKIVFAHTKFGLVGRRRAELRGGRILSPGLSELLKSRSCRVKELWNNFKEKVKE